MSFQNNFGKLREIGRMLVLPTNEIKNLLKRNVFDKYSINKVIDFGAGTLYWSNWFSKIIGKQNVYAIDVIFQKTPPDTDIKCFSCIDDVEIKQEKTLFYICDVIHHLPNDVWNDVKNKAFEKCDIVVIKDIDCRYKFKNFMNKMHDRIINGEKIHNVNPDNLIKDFKTSGFIYIYIYNIHKLWYSHFVIIAQKYK